LRAYVLFVVAVFYFFLARALARHGAEGFVSDVWSPVAEQLMLAFLLVMGYAAMGFAFQRQLHPISEQGLPVRQGWSGEFSMGLATGWGIALLCVIPMTLAGGIAVALSGRMTEWGWLLADTVFFLAATLADEVAFRGYAFQCFRDAVGPIGATIGFAFYYSMVQTLVPGSNRVSFMVSFVFSLMLSTAYLRTRALWVSWGINFGWKASRALLFGLAVSGVSSHSSIVQGDPMGAFWLTGGGFGLDGTWIAFVVVLAAFPVVLRMTRDLNFQHNAPLIVPGGIPVDLDAIAKAQHEAAMGPATTPLVQITPNSEPPRNEEQPAASRTDAAEPPAAQ
jgi:membrane protease YdiL (CAAX protease family)